MKRWLLIPLVFAAVVLVWLALHAVRREGLTSAVGLTASAQPNAKEKPICASLVHPNVAAPTDCIPQHLANLPPDPGEAGKLTIDGIDVDKDGVRDDVQRLIAENWGYSERSVAALRLIAKATQQQVLTADSASAAQTRAVAENTVMKAVDCYSLSVPQEVKLKNAMTAVVLEVVNTPERLARKFKFEETAANRIYELTNEAATELCGYDPAKLPS